MKFLCQLPVMLTERQAFYIGIEQSQKQILPEEILGWVISVEVIWACARRFIEVFEIKECFKRPFGAELEPFFKLSLSKLAAVAVLCKQLQAQKRRVIVVFSSIIAPEGCKYIFNTLFLQAVRAELVLTKVFP